MRLYVNSFFYIRVTTPYDGQNHLLAALHRCSSHEIIYADDRTLTPIRKQDKQLIKAE